MKNLNLILLAGALARNPELRYTPSGTAVLEMTVAGERRVTGADGRERTIPFYENVQAIGKVAEALAERNYVQGTPVMVEGQLEYSEWEATEGGKRSMLRTRITGAMRELAGAPDVIHDAGGNARLAGGLNEVTFTGNVVADADLRYTPAGDAVLELRCAISERYRDRQNQPQEKTHWVSVTLWRDLAEAHKDLKKGDPIHVQGALVDEAWTDREGNKRRTKKVEASRVIALARSASASTARPATPRPEATKPAARQGGLDIDQGLDDFPPQEEDLPF